MSRPPAIDRYLLGMIVLSEGLALGSVLLTHIHHPGLRITNLSQGMAVLSFGVLIYYLAMRGIVKTSKWRWWSRGGVRR